MEGLRVGVPAEYFAEGLDAEVRRAVEKAIESLRAAGLHDHAGIAAAHALCGADVLRDGDGGGERQPGALRWRALRLSRAGREDALRDVPRDARARIRARGEAAHPAGHLCAERGLLRRVLPQGAAGAARAGGGFSEGVSRRWMSS